MYIVLAMAELQNGNAVMLPVELSAGEDMISFVFENGFELALL